MQSGEESLNCDRCGRCCIQTSMQLSPEDIRRLRGLGYDPKRFTARVEGFKTLRNVRGACYFLDRKTNTCKIYRDRPEGCRYYPIVYSISEGKPTVDTEVCPRTFTVTEEEMKRIAPRLARLSRQLIKGKKSQLEE